MANLSLELLTTGQGFSPIGLQVKGENMTHLVTAYHQKYVHLITFNAITSRHSTSYSQEAKSDFSTFRVHVIYICICGITGKVKLFRL